MKNQNKRDNEHLYFRKLCNDLGRVIHILSPMALECPACGQVGAKTLLGTGFNDTWIVLYHCRYCTSVFALCYPFDAQFYFMDVIELSVDQLQIFLGIVKDDVDLNYLKPVIRAQINRSNGGWN